MYKCLILAPLEDTKIINDRLENGTFLFYQNNSITTLYDKENREFVDAICTLNYQWIIINVLFELEFLTKGFNHKDYLNKFIKKWKFFQSHLEFLGLLHRLKVLEVDISLIKDKKQQQFTIEIYDFLREELSSFNFIENYEKIKNLPSIPLFYNTSIHYDPFKLNKDIFLHKSLKSLFMKTRLLDGIHRIQVGDGKHIDLFINNFHLFKQKKLKERTLLVGFNAAVPKRNEKVAPFFSGIGLANKLNLPIIAISDVTISMSKNLQLAWYAGNNKILDFQHVISNLLEGFAKKFETNLILFGGSGAGFASLVQATLLECRAKVIVFNPQTDIEKYLKKPLDNYIKNAFINEDTDKSLFSNIISSVSIKDIKPNIELLYLQNIDDEHHVKYHLQSFFTKTVLDGKKLQVFNNQKVSLYFGSWGEGHVAPNSLLIYNILQRASMNENFQEICKKLCDDTDDILNMPHTSFYDLSSKTISDVEKFLNIEYSYHPLRKELAVKTCFDKNLKLGIAYYLYNKNNNVIAKSQYSLDGSYIFENIEKEKNMTLKLFIRDINNLKVTKKIKLF